MDEEFELEFDEELLLELEDELLDEFEELLLLELDELLELEFDELFELELEDELLLELELDPKWFFQVPLLTSYSSPVRRESATCRFWAGVNTGTGSATP